MNRQNLLILLCMLLLFPVSCLLYTSMWGARGLKEHEDYFRAEDIGLSGHTIPANLDAYYPRPIFLSLIHI